ncbi:MAG: M28 family metallopeptidase [Treponema sp.]|nr:M28 family metallopeptidase [Treponema sp.]
MISELSPLPWGRFMEFISPNANRFSIITGLLEEALLTFRVFEADGNRHIIVSPEADDKNYLNRPPPTILVAHYDRVDGSPGANDNSAGVFLLLETGLRFKKAGNKNWIIIFSDKEELKPGEGLNAQGAFALASMLKNLGMENSRIFCFDACGTGDTLVISSTIEHLLKNEKGKEKQLKSIIDLRNYALKIARDLNMAKVILAPTLFSDDAGFFMGGLAAQTITMLPEAESSQLAAQLRKNTRFANSLINAELRRSNNKPASIPQTWKSLNSPKDSHFRLTPKNFKTVVRFAQALCRE